VRAARPEFKAQTARINTDFLAAKNAENANFKSGGRCHILLGRFLVSTINEIAISFIVPVGNFQARDLSAVRTGNLIFLKIASNDISHQCRARIE
jgi:hypothetical protein